jgi:hypothetical protein
VISRKIIFLSAVPLLVAAWALPATANPSRQAKPLPAGQTSLRPATALSSANQSQLNSDAELNMIQLQSLMSQRQNAIQTTTNMLNGMNDNLNTVAKNIGGGCSPNC